MRSMSERLWQIALAIGAFFGGRLFKVMDERARDVREMRSGLDKLVAVAEMSAAAAKEEREHLRRDLNWHADSIKKELHDQVTALRGEIQQVRIEGERRFERMEERIDDVEQRPPHPGGAARVRQELGCWEPPH